MSCRILAISGSLRKASSNTALLRAAAILAPNDVNLVFYDNLGKLPLFNPDEEQLPESVQDFRDQIGQSDGLMIASPEYAHGVTGAIKNALDWAVGGPEMVDKPIALINASGRATHAYASLAEILSTMAAKIIPAASMVIPLPHNKITTDFILENKRLSDLLLLSIQELVRAILIDRSEKQKAI